MTKPVLVATVVCLALLGPRHLAAQPTTSSPATTSVATPSTEAKTPSGPKQRMKDCAEKWKTEKAEKSVKGAEAYRAFMRVCLKN